MNCHRSGSGGGGSSAWLTRAAGSSARSNLRRQFIDTSHPARANLMQFWFHGSSPLNGLISLGSARNFGAKVRGAYTYMAKDAGAGRRQVAAKHGLSHHERDLLTEGLDLMRQRERAALFVSVEAGREPPAESIVRAVARRVRSDLARRQRRAGMRRQYALSVFEARGRDGLPKFGAHIVALMPTAPARDKLIESLNGAAYDGHVLAKPVYDWSGLAGYLLKEAT